MADRLEDLLLLDTGWDGGVAPPLDPVLIQRTWNVAEQIGQYLPYVQEPRVIPTVNGGLVLEWIQGDNELGIELGETTLVSIDVPARSLDWEGDLVDAPVDIGSLLIDCFS